MFAHLKNAINEGIRRSLHTGIQIYISQHGIPLLDEGFGEASPGTAIDAHTIMLWRSAGKPLTAALLLLLLAEHQLSLEARLGDVLPDCGDKSSLSFHQLLTHQSGFPETDTGWPHAAWSESVRRVIDTPATLAVGTAAYHPQSSWFLLAEAIRILDARVNDKRSFPEVLRHRLLQPAMLHRTHCGITAAESAGWSDNTLPTLYERQQGKLVPSAYSSGDWLSAPSAGGNLRGPIRELGRFYELLLREGLLPDGRRLLQPEVIRQLTTPIRRGEFDLTLQHKVDFAAGVICNSARYGADTVPYGFGKAATDASFGHGGAQCSIGFCDPQHGLVVAWAANAFCGEGQHQRRNQMINDAVWKDLGLL